MSSNFQANWSSARFYTARLKIWLYLRLTALKKLCFCSFSGTPLQLPEMSRETPQENRGVWYSVGETKCEGFEDVAGGIVPWCLEGPCLFPAAFSPPAQRGGLGRALLSLPQLQAEHFQPCPGFLYSFHPSLGSHLWKSAESLNNPAWRVPSSALCSKQGNFKPDWFIDHSLLQTSFERIWWLLFFSLFAFPPCFLNAGISQATPH